MINSTIFLLRETNCSQLTAADGYLAIFVFSRDIVIVPFLSLHRTKRVFEEYTAIEPYLLKETQFFSFFNSIRPKFYASRLSIVILQIDQSPTRSFVNEPHKRQPAPTARFASKKRGSALLIRRLFHRRGN